MVNKKRTLKQPVKQPKPTNQPNPVLQMVQNYVGSDLLQIFGKTGTGKSKFVFYIAMVAAREGKKVFYYDTEGNLSNKERTMIEKTENIEYIYEPRFNMLRHSIFSMPKGYDYIIIDSTGYPILVKFATMTLKQRGDALLELIAINGKLKDYCKEYDATAIAVTQPESEFAKVQGHTLRPFGDKSLHATKEIWKFEPIAFGKITKSNINAFRSREVGRGEKLAELEISDTGTKVRLIRK